MKSIFPKKISRVMIDEKVNEVNEDSWFSRKKEEFVWWLEDIRDEYLEYGSFRLYFIRKILGIYKPWSDEKILKSIINKMYDIVGATEEQPMKDKYSNWYDYLLGEKVEDWYNQYHFTIEQDTEFKKYFYKTIKLHKDYWGFPSDTRIFRAYPWESLRYFFSLKNEEDYKSVVSIEDIDHYSSWWYRILNFLFPDYLTDDKPHWEPVLEDPEEIDEEDDEDSKL